MSNHNKYKQRFLQAEAIERDHLRKAAAICKELTVLAEAPPGTYCAYDAVTEFMGKKHITEIKVRNFLSTSYPTAYLEKKKVTSLIEIIKEKRAMDDYDLFYYAFYPKSKDVFLIDLLEQPKTEAYNIWCAKKTMGGSEKTYKDMYSYRLADAWKINLETGEIRPPLDPCNKEMPDIEI